MWPAKPLYNSVLGVSFSSEEAEPLSLDAVKKRLKITFDNADDELMELIGEVRQIFEEVLGISIVRRGVEAVMQFQIGERMELPYGPVVDVTSAKDADENAIDHNDGLIVEIPGGFWVLKSKYDYINLVYTAGYTDSTLPKGLKNAMIREIAWRYNHRGDEEGDSNRIHVREAYKFKRSGWLL